MTCSACNTDSHDRETHLSPEKAQQYARALEEAGDHAQAKAWRIVGLTLRCREVTDER